MPPNEFVAFERAFIRFVDMVYALQIVQHFCKLGSVMVALFHDLRFFGQQGLQHTALMSGQR